MTNKEFIEKYGNRELLDITDSLYTRLSVLKMNRGIGKFRISKRKKIVYFYIGGTIIHLEVAKVYSLTDDKLLSLLEQITLTLK